MRALIAWLWKKKKKESLLFDRLHQYHLWYIRQWHLGPRDVEYLSGWGYKVGNALQADLVQLHGTLFCCREAPMLLLFQEAVCQISTWLADQISGLAAMCTMWASDRKGSEVLCWMIFGSVCWDYEARAKRCFLCYQESKIIHRNKTNCIRRNSISFC